jgi:thiamine-phosphate pyrophosphorylase
MLYAITDSQLLPGEKLFTGVEAALKGGCKYIQYRDKSGDTAKRLQEATRLLALCKHYQANLIINDDAPLAQAVGAQGVHLGQGDGDVAAARRLLGENIIIGVTCHDSLALAEKAIAEGANYIAFGRFFPSSTKPDARPAPLSLLGEAREKFPHATVAAIGGITLNNLRSVKAAGADLIAVCNEIFAAQDIEAQVKLFIELEDNYEPF